MTDKEIWQEIINTEEYKQLQAGIVETAKSLLKQLENFRETHFNKTSSLYATNTIDFDIENVCFTEKLNENLNYESFGGKRIVYKWIAMFPMPNGYVGYKAYKANGVVFLVKIKTIEELCASIFEDHQAVTVPFVNTYTNMGDYDYPTYKSLHDYFEGPLLESYLVSVGAKVVEVKKND